MFSSSCSSSTWASSIPVEIGVEIWKFLSFSEARRCLLICKGIQFLDEERVWRGIFLSRWEPSVMGAAPACVSSRVRREGLRLIGRRGCARDEGGWQLACAVVDRATRKTPPRSDSASVVSWKETEKLAIFLRRPPKNVLRSCTLCNEVDLACSDEEDDDYSPLWTSPCGVCLELVHTRCVEQYINNNDPTNVSCCCWDCGQEFELIDRFPRSLGELLRQTWRDRKLVCTRLRNVSLPLFCLFTGLVMLVENRSTGLSWKIPSLPAMSLFGLISVLWLVYLSPRFQQAVLWWSPSTWNLYIAVFASLLGSTMFFLVSFVDLQPHHDQDRLVLLPHTHSSFIHQQQVTRCGIVYPRNTLRGTKQPTTTTEYYSYNIHSIVRLNNIDSDDDSNYVNFGSQVEKLHATIRSDACMRFAAGLNALFFISSSSIIIALFWLTAYRMSTVKNMKPPNQNSPPDRRRVSSYNNNTIASKPQKNMRRLPPFQHNHHSGQRCHFCSLGICLQNRSR